MLFHDEKHAKIARDTIKHLMELQEQRFKTALVPKGSKLTPTSRKYHLKLATGSTPAYIRHTSGTSTGEPKPIYTDNFEAVGALPVFEGSFMTKRATFTTTPLYHGGPADCFRAWTSASMIWLYPGIQDKPITAEHVVRAYDVTEDYCDAHPVESIEHRARVKYFTAVPYVIEAMAGMPKGIDIFQSMDLVGVGGAALSTKLGDQIVSRNIRLISRYGSSECGFILSSRRDYDNDKGWQYLNQYPSPSLIFERREDGLAELVLKDWPFMAKSNRADGSFSTSDLFEPHPTGRGWKYHSRADSQLTLSTGKKFDPTPMENQVSASGRLAKLVRDAYIFGDDRPFPGVFLFRHPMADNIDDTQMIQKMWPVIEEENAKCPPHARISKHMLVVMPNDSHELAKTNKGTVIRRRVEKDYFIDIHKAFDHHPKSSGQGKPLKVEEIRANVIAIVKDKLPGGHRTDEQLWNADLYDMGVDSLACMEIQQQIQGDYGQAFEVDFPTTLVYDCGSAQGIAEFVTNLCRGNRMEKKDNRAVMRSIAGHYDKMLLEKRKRLNEEEKKDDGCELDEDGE